LPIAAISRNFSPKEVTESPLNEDVNKVSGHIEERARDLPSRLRTLLARRRLQLASALILAAVIPLALRGTLLPGRLTEGAAIHTFVANIAAVLFAFWMRLSIESYPGIRRAYLILLSACVAHGCALISFLLTRLTYDRVGLVLGFAVHVGWLYVVFVVAELQIRRRIAVVPFGRIARLQKIDDVDWLVLSRARLHDTRGCHAIVADFDADLPDEWEAFLAEAALAGRIVYQVKQLSESLTGRVELEQLSENSFGSLVPARGYFYLKSAADYLLAIFALPFALPLMALIAISVRLDSRGPALFRQKRIGHAGKLMTVYKFRTMHEVPLQNHSEAAITQDNDERITRIGRTLRRFRIDELPQIINILKGEMSWIGPRPEAEPLSAWYQREIPFYRYRHVVKPGISGWAQVSQGHVATVDQVHRKLQYDFYYIKYFSPWLDLLILVRTLTTIFSGFGAR
jgi:lipopolysaccharide/colanic/teichoic acid biosynthesis glycosyltransferase